MQPVEANSVVQASGYRFSPLTLAYRAGSAVSGFVYNRFFTPATAPNALEGRVAVAGINTEEALQDDDFSIASSSSETERRNTMEEFELVEGSSDEAPDANSAAKAQEERLRLNERLNWMIGKLAEKQLARMADAKAAAFETTQEQQILEGFKYLNDLKGSEAS